MAEIDSYGGYLNAALQAVLAVQALGKKNAGDLDRARAAAGLVGAAGSAAGIPYASLVTAPFDFASIALSDLPDEQKAYYMLNKAGGTGLNLFFPGTGMIAEGFGNAAGNLIFGDNQYGVTRTNEARSLPTTFRNFNRSLSSAFTPEDISSTADAFFRQSSPGVYATRTHLDTGGLDQQINDAIAKRRAFIGTPEGAMQRRQFQPFNNAFARLAESTKDTVNNQRISYLTNPEQTEEQAYGLWKDWTGTYDRFIKDDQGRTPYNAPHLEEQRQRINELAGITKLFGFNYDAAAKRIEDRRREAEQNQAWI